MNQQKFDIVVIGGGPGGYPAAIRAAQLGKSVALIEAKELGGTCLNRGCIPSKTLIHSADVLQQVREAEEFGIILGNNITFDYGKMVQRKDDVVARIRKSLEGLIASNKIHLFRGFGKITGPREVKVTGQDNALILCDKIIIATGSEPRSIPAFPFDGKKILDSTQLLEMQALPKKLLIIGGGIIGCEFASLFNILGVDVTILEMMPRIIPMEADGVSQALTRAFRRKGIKIETNVLVESIDTQGAGVQAKLAGGKTVEGEIALVAVGRQLNLANIGLDKIGLTANKSGILEVNERMETQVPGVYAIGDIASKWWLAHVASHQGLVAGANACGGKLSMHYNAVPNVIYTVPEIGSVGLSLEKAIEEGYHAVLGAFPFQALGKSQAILQTDGFAQVVIDKTTGQILGAQVVGYDASNLVAEMAVCIANELTIESVSETIHAHPTVAEVWLEAALVAQEQPLHLPPKKK